MRIAAMAIVCLTVGCGSKAGNSTTDPNNNGNNNNNTNNTNVDATNTHSGTITDVELWAAGTHTVDGDLVINGNVTIAAGTTLLMQPDSSIDISDGGSLTIAGTEAAKVTITSSKSSPAPGDWKFIDFEESADGSSSIQWTVIKYGGSDSDSAALIVEDGAQLSLGNSAVQYSASFGLQLNGSSVLTNSPNNSYTQNALGAVNADPDSAGQLTTGTYGPNTVQGVWVNSGTLSDNANWLDLGVPYIVSNLTVSKSVGTAILTLSPNVTVWMQPDTTWTIHGNGALNAVGTASQPITITSSKSSPAPGDWVYIDIYGDSLAAYNHLEYTQISYGGSDSSYGAVIIEDGASALVQHSTISYSASYGISTLGAGALPTFASNTLIHNNAAIYLDSADVADGLGAGVYGPNTAEGILIGGGTVAHSATWANVGAPWVLKDDVIVNGTAGTVVLTINPNVTVLFEAEIRLTIQTQGSLIAAGTSAAPITFDALVAAQHWAYVDLYGANNTLTYVVFDHGESDTSYGYVIIESSDSTTALNSVTYVDLYAQSCGLSLIGSSTTSTVTGSSATVSVCP